MIIKFIDNLHNMLSSNSVNIDLETTNNLISELKNILNLLNDNIKTLESNKQTYHEIKNDIVDLSLKANSENNSKNNYKSSSELAELRTGLNNFANTVEKTKSQINEKKTNTGSNKGIV